MNREASANVTVKLVGKDTDVFHECEVLMAAIHNLVSEHGLKTAISLVFDVCNSPEEGLDTPILELNLSERPRNVLLRCGVSTLGGLLQKTDDDLLSMTNMGQRSVDEIIEMLSKRGLSLRDS